LTTECYRTDHDIFEVEILNKIAEQQRLLSNAAHTSHVIGSLESFQLRGPAGEHRCIVMPVLGSNLGRQVHRFPNRRISVKTVKEIAKQLLQGLAFLHDDCGIIHTGIADRCTFRGTITDQSRDLQPANICIEIGSGEIERACARIGVGI
jgi:serine/threonine-protein kinase SRPK3